MALSDPVSSLNSHIVCQYRDKIATFVSFPNRNPLQFSVPLLLLQFVLFTSTSHCINLCLRPLGLSSIVTQILGGLLYGPSLLGNAPAIQNTLFPGRSLLILETAATFGVIFFFFTISVGSNAGTMFHPSKNSLIIGIPAMFITLITTVLFSLYLGSYVKMDDTLSRALPFIAMSQAVTGFPNIAYFLSELKLSKSDLGQIATSSAMMCDFSGMVIIWVILSIVHSQTDPLRYVLSLSSMLSFVLAMVYIVGPYIRRASMRVGSGKLAEFQTFLFFVGCMATAFVTEVIGQHFVLGPLVLGLLVPYGQPMGAGLISKLEYPVGKLLYPMFLMMSGLKTNVLRINLWSLWIVLMLMMFSMLIKVAAVAYSCRFLSLNFHDSVVIGLMLNARGVCELIAYNLCREKGILTDQEFALCVLTVIGVTSIISPLIKLLYDPTKRDVNLNRRTIQHLKSDGELRILVCIKNEDNVSIIVNLLEASHATEQSHIPVIAVHVEIVDRAAQVVVAHPSPESLQNFDLESGHIINSLLQYETCNEGCVTILMFSAISHGHTMHEDIFRVAKDQTATIVILPFHKRWERDGSMSENHVVKNMNMKVLDHAPCSVGILVDRSVLTESISILNMNSQSVFRVAVIFIGGDDDAEALCYGARMGRHVNVRLTIIRFLLFGCDGDRYRKQDNTVIDEVKRANKDNQGFVYREETVKDGGELAAGLREIGNQFELIIVGRYHQESEMVTGLGGRSECPELGAVGDVLVSEDFQGTASLLVVQQQRMPTENHRNGVVRTVVESHESGQNRPVRSSAAGENISHESGQDWPVNSSAGEENKPEVVSHESGQNRPVSDGDPRWEISVDREGT